jgi:hypothetical protein
MAASDFYGSGQMDASLFSRVRGLIAPEDAVEKIVAAASNVQRDPTDPRCWLAPTSHDAVAWLVAVSNANANNAGYDRVDRPSIAAFGNLIGYRGQAGHYATVTPTLYRGKTEEEQFTHDRAFSWFAGALGGWHDRNFRYLSGGTDCDLELEALIGAAQHYRLATFLVDWSFDPLVAAFFAVDKQTVGGTGTVLIQRFASGARTTYSALLPPPFLSRVWRQRGLFAWHCSSDTSLPSAHETEVKYYDRVQFPISVSDVEWATRWHPYYYEDPLKLESIAEWSINVSLSRAPYPDNCIGASYDSFLHACERSKIDPPPLFSECNTTVVTEDVPLMMDYIDVACIRVRESSRIVLDARALLTILQGMPRQSWVHSSVEAAHKVDSRSAVFKDKYFAMRLREEIAFLEAIEPLAKDRWVGNPYLLDL